MSIPLDRLYQYIESIAEEIYGNNVLIYHFFPHGSKNINDLVGLNEHVVRAAKSQSEVFYLPHIYCHDQEPLNYDLYSESLIHYSLDPKLNQQMNEAFKTEPNLRVRPAGLYDSCLLVHSEKNGSNLLKYNHNENFLTVYYWSHALIAQDWFRYARYVDFKKTPKKKFLVYNRAWAGSREYRLKFTDLLVEHQLINHCKTTFNPYDNNSYYKNHSFVNPAWKPTHVLENYFNQTTADGSYSADFDHRDYQLTDFEVVLETLFDDDRIHLTEKSLRPIACKQPFILASTAGSLEYLRSYGFKTFGSIIDESYDLIQDPQQRLLKIIQTMTDIVLWTPAQREKNIAEINSITEYNQTYFFSSEFNNKIVQELKENFTVALEQLEKNNTARFFIKRHSRVLRIPEIQDYFNSISSRKERVIAFSKARKIRDAWRKQNPHK